MLFPLFFSIFFFFNDPATTEIYTLSLHDALPISSVIESRLGIVIPMSEFVSRYKSCCSAVSSEAILDRKSTRLNSSHSQISYAVFCLKKKKTKNKNNKELQQK